MGTQSLVAWVTEGQGEGEGSSQSHVALPYAIVTTHSWDRSPCCLVQAIGEEKLSSTLQALLAGLMIKLTQDRLAEEKLILGLQTLLIFNTVNGNSA